MSNQAPNNQAVQPVATPGMREQAVGIAEVAALAGVSTATVSRALSQPQRVSAKTRERVLEVVRKTGYSPHVAGRSLRAARSDSVLVVVPNLITPFFANLLQSVDQVLSDHGYSLLIGNLQFGARKIERMVDLVFGGGVDGVILLTGQSIGRPGRAIHEAGVPVVAISVPSAGSDIPPVILAERKAAAEVARHLLGLGHRRFGYIAGPEGNYCDAERWAAYSATLAAAGVAFEDIWQARGDFHAPSGVQAAMAFLALPEAARPTAVFAASDSMAIAFMRTLHDHDVRVPRDVSLVGFDGIDMADFTEPRLTTVRQPREAMGRAAVELLVRMMRREPLDAKERLIVLDGALRIAESTGPPAAGRNGR